MPTATERWALHTLRLAPPIAQNPPHHPVFNPPTGLQIIPLLEVVSAGNRHFAQAAAYLRQFRSDEFFPVRVQVCAFGHSAGRGGGGEGQLYCVGSNTVGSASFVGLPAVSPGGCRQS